MIANILDSLSLLLLISIVPIIWLVYKRKIRFVSGVFSGTFLFLMSFGISVYVFRLFYGINPIDSMVTAVSDSFTNTFKNIPDVTDGQIAELSRLVTTLKDAYYVLMPTLVVIALLLWSYLCHMAGKGIFALFRRDVSGFLRFCDLKMPKTAVLLAAVAYIISIFTDGGYLGYAFVNFSAIIFAVTSFCGLSMVDFWIRKKIRFSVLRFLIYILVFMFLNLGFGIFFLVGMADAIFDLRKPKIRNNDRQ